MPEVDSKGGGGRPLSAQQNIKHKSCHIICHAGFGAFIDLFVVICMHGITWRGERSVVSAAPQCITISCKTRLSCLNALNLIGCFCLNTACASMRGSISLSSAWRKTSHYVLNPQGTSCWHCVLNAGCFDFDVVTYDLSPCPRWLMGIGAVDSLKSFNGCVGLVERSLWPLGWMPDDLIVSGWLGLCG